jgi:hypothetical protein
MKATGSERVSGLDCDNLSDPATCGEDLAYNAKRAMELAPNYCGRCEDYHFLAPIRRFANEGDGSGIGGDRQRLIRLVSGCIEQAESNKQAIDVVVAGAVDTGTLATCAHAASTRTVETFSRVRYTVLDICRTPLELCREYALRHNLRLTTQLVDLVESDDVYQADVLLHHSLFRFLDPDSHVATLRKLSRWLKPGGRMIFSMSIDSTASDDLNEAYRRSNVERIWKSIESGTVEINEPENIFRSRIQSYLDRNRRNAAGFRNSRMLREMIEAAGIPILSFEEKSRLISLVDGATAPRLRVLAVLGTGQ